MSNPEQQSGRSRQISLAGTTQAIGILTAVLYVFGFIVVNTYLAQFGVARFELLEVRYVPAGVLVGALLFIYSVTAGLNLYYGPRKVGYLVSLGTKDGKFSKPWGIYSMFHAYAGVGFGLALATSIVGGLLLDDESLKPLLIPMALFYLLDSPLRERGTLDRFPRVESFLLFAFYCIFLVMYLYLVDNYKLHALFGTFLGLSWALNLVLHEQDRAGSKSFASRYMKVTVLPMILLAFCLFIGSEIYGEVSRGRGGGKPAVIRLVLTDDAVTKLSDSLPLEGNRSQHLLLIGETNQELIVVPVNDDGTAKNALRLRKDLVLAVVSVQPESKKADKENAPQ
jgi:hypothetical protein